MKSQNFFALVLALFGLLPVGLLGVSYYDVIENELELCQSVGGKVIGFENGQVSPDSGCPGCFCQYADKSVCKMEHVGTSICKQGQFQTFYLATEYYRFPDLTLESSARGYTFSNPTAASFHFIDKNSQLGHSLRFASAVQMPKFFGTDWANEQNKKYLFFVLSLYDYEKEKFQGDVSLFHNRDKIKTWSVDSPSADLLLDQVYVFLDIEKQAGEHQFTLVTSQKEMSKENNIFSFYLDKKNFQYIKYDQKSDYKQDFYLTFDNKKVDAADLERKYFEAGQASAKTLEENIEDMVTLQFPQEDFSAQRKAIAPAPQSLWSRIGDFFQRQWIKFLELF